MPKKATPKAVPEPAATPEREPAALEMDVRIHSINTSGNVLANASVTLGGCFAIRNLKVVGSAKGPFVSMPCYKTNEGLKDVCFPCTKEFHQQFSDAVVAAYQQALEQLPQRHQEQEAPPAPSMSM